MCTLTYVVSEPTAASSALKSPLVIFCVPTARMFAAVSVPVTVPPLAGQAGGVGTPAGGVRFVHRNA